MSSLVLYACVGPWSTNIENIFRSIWLCGCVLRRGGLRELRRRWPRGCDMGENADGMGVVSPHGDGYERTASNVRLPPIERESNSNTFFYLSVVVLAHSDATAAVAAATSSSCGFHWICVDSQWTHTHPRLTQSDSLHARFSIDNFIENIYWQRVSCVV